MSANPPAGGGGGGLKIAVSVECCPTGPPAGAATMDKQTRRDWDRDCWVLGHQASAALAFLAPAIVVGTMVLLQQTGEAATDWQYWKFFIAIWVGIAVVIIQAGREMAHAVQHGLTAWTAGWQIAICGVGITGTVLIVCQKDLNLATAYYTSGVWITTAAACLAILVPLTSTRFFPERDDTMKFWCGQCGVTGIGGMAPTERRGTMATTKSTNRSNGDEGDAGTGCCSTATCETMFPLVRDKRFGCFEMRVRIGWLWAALSIIAQLLMIAIKYTTSSFDSTATAYFLIPSYFFVGWIFAGTLTEVAVAGKDRGAGQVPLSSAVRMFGAMSALAGLILIAVDYWNPSLEPSQINVLAYSLTAVGTGLYMIGILLDTALFGPWLSVDSKNGEKDKLVMTDATTVATLYEPGFTR